MNVHPSPAGYFANPCAVPPPRQRKSTMQTRLPSRCLAASLLLMLAASPALTAEPATKAAPPAAPLQSLAVYPAEVHLNGPRDTQRLGVLGEYADGRRWDLSRAARFASSAPEVATVDAAGLVRGVSDGEATVSVEANGQKATARVRVQ